MTELKIGAVLKKLMGDGRHTITSVSKSTDVPKSTISEWLNNRAPNPVFAVRVAKHLGVSLHYLLFGEEDSSEPLHRLLKEELFSGTFEINVKRVKVQKPGGQDGI